MRHPRACLCPSTPWLISAPFLGATSRRPPTRRSRTAHSRRTTRSSVLPSSNLLRDPTTSVRTRQTPLRILVAAARDMTGSAETCASLAVAPSSLGSRAAHAGCSPGGTSCFLLQSVLPKLHIATISMHGHHAYNATRTSFLYTLVCVRSHSLWMPAAGPFLLPAVTPSSPRAATRWLLTQVRVCIHG